MSHKFGEHQSLSTSLYVSLDISIYVRMCVHVDYVFVIYTVYFLIFVHNMN